ncbi:MAG TPA: DNA double-strand break repair nuclease NurA [Anaerolineales bacterium]|nr:DNA double-strand break repair nuclease NurA [Anaerolineales bacterium]
MPINFQQIYARIREIAAGADENKRTLEEKRELARQLLGTYDSELDYLQRKVETATAIDSNLRCAVPLNEPLTSNYPPPAPVADVTVIAADGSQVNPDRHGSIQFSIINVGIISMKLHSGQAPEICVDTEMLYGDDLISNGNPISDGMVAMRRDISERLKLDEVSKGIKGQVVNLTDGTIELWGAKGDDPQAYADFVEKYLKVLARLHSRGVITAGYVEKPSADLVVRLLEIATADQEQIQRLREYQPLRGVSDRWLYGERENPLLPPGHRSAVFALQSGSVKKYKGPLALHFFYLNVGTLGHPWPVRVEVPQWVAEDRKKLELLHSVLMEQCNMMGSKPYPYLLHRAHETAVVRREEKEQVEQLLALELRRVRAEIGERSNKDSAKALPGRTRTRR